MKKKVAFFGNLKSSPVKGAWVLLWFQALNFRETMKILEKRSWKKNLFTSAKQTNKQNPVYFCSSKIIYFYLNFWETPISIFPGRQPQFSKAFNDVINKLNFFFHLFLNNWFFLFDIFPKKKVPESMILRSFSYVFSLLSFCPRRYSLLRLVSFRLLTTTTSTTIK